MIKVLYINQEMIPYVPETNLAIMGKELPQKMQEAGFEVRTFMPKWGNINERRGQLHEVIRLSGMNIIIDETDHPLIIKVASIPMTRIQVFFIDNEDHFSNRHTTVDELGIEYPDNGERAIFFARGVLETVKKMRWIPDIIHCQGWMGAVIPLYVKTAYRDEPAFALPFHRRREDFLGRHVRIEEYTVRRRTATAYPDVILYQIDIQIGSEFADEMQGFEIEFIQNVAMLHQFPVMVLPFFNRIIIIGDPDAHQYGSGQGFNGFLFFQIREYQFGPAD